MTERFINEIGVPIIQTNNLPQTVVNEETGESEIIHMIQIGNEIYVSEALYNGLKCKMKLDNGCDVE